MSIIDFKEIPQANTGRGDQDTFELFARDFLHDILGFKIISQPNRGADGGKDILAEEIQCGTLSESKITWLVSCKHFAHSGKSVSETDEMNIGDRLMQHHANGFLGFYSTIASSGLGNRLDSLSNRYQICVFDGKEIERRLFAFNNSTLFERYFPNSFHQWHTHNKAPSRLLSKYEPLCCCVCGKDLLKPENGKLNGIIVFDTDSSTHKIWNVSAVCRGRCDNVHSSELRRLKSYSGWESISDFVLPSIYLKKEMGLINNLFYKNPQAEFTESGIESYKSVLIALSQLVLRDHTEEEWKRVLDLNSLPDWI